MKEINPICLVIPDFAREVYFGRNKPMPIIVCEPGSTVDVVKELSKFIDEQLELAKTQPMYATIPWPLPPLEIEPPPPRNRRLEKTWFKKFERRVS